jgi:hypothetical protein
VIDVAAQPTGPAPAPSEPYVGLRPFERSERQLFFGRERDAQFLRDKTLSAPLTLFYARSGVGKSSILRALLADHLEREDAHVIYFDAWPQADPLGALKTILVDRAAGLGVPLPAAGSPSLAALIGLMVNTAENRSVVLLLDGFEQLLVGPPGASEPLRKELAALVRSRWLPAHVVLSLREEYLATLEPLKDVILNLFASTYRLEPLPDDHVRRAITEPALAFGVIWDPPLVDRVVQDLRAYRSGENPIDGQLELPFVQLVCSQMWRRRPAGQGRLTLAMYPRQGVEEILKDYVAAVMPRHWRARLLTATMLRSLAPPSGLKLSFSVDDLVASHEHLDRQHVTDELTRLKDLRILNARAFGREERYELQHDVLIRVLQPWRDEVLRWARFRARLRRLLLVGAVAVALTGTWAVANQSRLAELATVRSQIKTAQEVQATLDKTNRELRENQAKMKAQQGELERNHQRLRAERESLVAEKEALAKAKTQLQGTVKDLESQTRALKADSNAAEERAAGVIGYDDK